MGTNKKLEKVDDGNNWITQNKLAKRWGVSPGTIINWRKAGYLPFFRLPGASKVLYPMEGIIELEYQNTTTIKGVSKKHNSIEFQGKMPVVSANSKRKWRI